MVTNSVVALVLPKPGSIHSGLFYFLIPCLSLRNGKPLFIVNLTLNNNKIQHTMYVYSILIRVFFSCKKH